MVLRLSTERLEREEKPVKLSMLKAYMLALFSHFVTKLLGDVYFSLYGPESMAELFDNEAKVLEDGDPMVEVLEEEVEDPSKGESESKQKKKRFKVGVDHVLLLTIFCSD